MPPGGASPPQARATGWNSPDEAVAFWPLLLCMSVGVIIYYYPNKVNGLLGTLGINWLYGLVWGNRGLWARAAVSFLVLFIAVKNAYRVEQGVEAWASWITTGTFSKAREPTLYKGIDANQPLVPTFAVLIGFCIVMANRGLLTESSLYALLWGDRGNGLRWLLVIGVLLLAASFADPISLFLANFNAYITQGQWPRTQAGPIKPLTPNNPLA